MSYQPPPPNQPNDFVVLVALVGGIYASVPLWEFVKPLVVWFLRTYQHSLGPGMTGFLDLVSPLALYALVVALIVGLLEGVLIPFVRFLLAQWFFERTQERLGKPSEEIGFFGVIGGTLGLVFIILAVIGAVSRQL
jgi:hypothetical protein